MVEWVPGIGASPNRVDALVHGADLMRSGWAESDQQSQFSSLAPPIKVTRCAPFKNSTSLESLMTDFQWLAVAVVTALSTARVSRLVTWDSFPPSVWLHEVGHHH